MTKSNFLQSGFDGFPDERRVRKELPSRYRNRQSKLNKSSSLHNLAHGFGGDTNQVCKKITLYRLLMRTI